MLKSCYLCKSKSIHFAFNKLSHEFWLCYNCGLYSLKFDYDYDKFIHDYYQKGYFTGDKKIIAYADYRGDKPVIAMNMRKYLRHFRSHLPNIPNLPNPPNRLLDCGCAMGFFMEEAQKMGFDPYGVDISEYAASYAKKLFPGKVTISPIEKIDKIFCRGAVSAPASTNIKFDVITMFDLIEHLKDPRLVLKKLKKLLKKNGILVLQTGDVSSGWARFQKENWHFFAPPQHLHFFSRKTITDLLNQSGYKVIKIKASGKWVSLRYLFHMMRFANRDRLGDFLYKKTHKNILGKIPIPFKFGDNMIIIASKGLALRS